MKSNWNNLQEDVLNRLAECRSKASDIVPLAKEIKRQNDVTSEDAFDYMVEWVCDWNNQFNLYDELVRNREKYIKKIDN